jgi:hypothetical protein
MSPSVTTAGVLAAEIEPTPLLGRQPLALAAEEGEDIGLGPGHVGDDFAHDDHHGGAR